MYGGPTIEEYTKVHVSSRVDELCRRVAVDASQPDTICCIDMYQCSEDAAVGGTEVAVDFLRSKLRRCVDQSLAGPCGVIDVHSQRVGCAGHMAQDTKARAPGQLSMARSGGGTA